MNVRSHDLAPVAGLARTDPDSSSAAMLLPDPGESPSGLAWPVIVLFATALVIFGLSTWAAVTHLAPGAVTVTANAVAIFMMFTVVHDASHHAISRSGWVNVAAGRAAMPFVSTAMAFSAWAFIHIEHHRHTNDQVRDPDACASQARWWQLPFRFATMDGPYLSFYVRNLARRPVAEVVETAMWLTASVALITSCALTGCVWTLAVVYLIPERIALIVLAWWFDWLPHHGLIDTQISNRYRATRVRVGMERVLTPLMLSQNYHLVHHLHPSIPFHRYLAAWRRNEQDYLDRDVVIATALGRQLSADEYRRWAQLNTSLLRAGSAERATPGSRFHRLEVAKVDRLTPDSVAITFQVPEHLRDTFRFEAGQHLTIRTDLCGDQIRRVYSICSPATGGSLRIAVKHLRGGAFSTFASQRLRPGDVLEVLPPAGRFGTPLDPNARRNYVAVAAGSGITPILSIAQTVLEVEPDSRFTLVYANRTAQTTMFTETLDGLQLRHGDRFEVIQVRSGDPQHPAALRGRVDKAKLEFWLANTFPPSTIDEWFLCGPVDLVTLIRNTLVDYRVDPARIHLELFYGFGTSPMAPPDQCPATLTFQLSGIEGCTELHRGETVLDAALRKRDDVPYACLGGACGTCKAKLVHGNVMMAQNFALGEADIKEGYVLTCQSHPTSPAVTVDYDA